MAKSATKPLDVLVVGRHPAAYLATLLLRQEPALAVAHAAGADAPAPDRLTLINARFFDLHPQLAALQPQIELSPVNGLRFVGDSPQLANESVSNAVAAYVGGFGQIREQMARLAAAAGVNCVTGGVQVGVPNESAVPVQVGRQQLRPRLLLVCDGADDAMRKALGFVPNWDAGVLRHYSFVRIADAGPAKLIAPPVVPISLDLGGSMSWGWLLRGRGLAQLSILQTNEAARAVPPRQQLARWAKVLESHGLATIADRELDGLHTVVWPVGGALGHEAVGDRALLIGPAGGFISACAEDVYPACWSAVLAAAVARRALLQPHVQDALQAFRHEWGTTLGDYLRGPQQNLRFLLPLIYRNPVMAARLTDAILLGQSVVR
jgi:flavin-dependent dehydrogenase